jgi:hypothetical protein
MRDRDTRNVGQSAARGGLHCGHLYPERGERGELRLGQLTKVDAESWYLKQCYVSDDQPVRSVRVAGHKGHLARLGYGEGASIGIVNGKDGMWVGEALTDEDADLCRSRDPPGDSPLWSLRRRQNDRGEQPGVLDRGGYQVPLSELPEVFEDLPCRPRPIVRVFGQRARDKAYALVIEDVVQASDIPGRRGAWPRGQAAEDG